MEVKGLHASKHARTAQFPDFFPDNCGIGFERGCAGGRSMVDDLDRDWGSRSPGFTWRGCVLAEAAGLRGAT